MNHTYRLLWSRRSHCFVVVGEHARRGGKSAGSILAGAVLAAAMLPMAPASAGPTDGVITQGEGRITRPDASTTVINQANPRLAIDWTSFSSAAGEKINFIQPDAASIALNRVTGGGRSELMGSLTANGQVFVINPNGVLFGPNASVNVGGLLASTLDMDSGSFYAGSQVLETGGKGAVANQGKLTANSGGYIALVGPRVINEGTISAEQGKVLMAAGDKVTLTLAGRSLASYTIDRGSLDALIDNRAIDNVTGSGTIRASGGQVTLDASAADKLSQAVVNHTGIIEAQTLGGKPGSIQLLGGIKSGDREAGDMLVAGKLDVSARNGGNGGLVKTSAARVNIDERAQVDLLAQELSGNSNGTWTNTSRDFLIAEGNGPDTSSSIGAKTLAKNLATGSKTYTTPNLADGTGDLYVNAKVEWNEAYRLTLKSSQSIYINSDIKATKGSLELWHGQSEASKRGHDYFVNNGATVSLPKGSNFIVSRAKNFAIDTYYVITELGNPQSVTGNDLQGISNKVVNYVLGADIDASATYRWNGDAGFVPISGFSGRLEGLGHTISNLYINNTQYMYAGLFGDLKPTGIIRNLVLENANVTNRALVSTVSVGSVVGQNEGQLFNVHARNMTVGTATGNAGGLVGNNKGEIRDSSAVGSVNVLISNGSIEGVGGLVGTQSGTIINSYAMATVSGRTSTGGLVGLMDGGSVSGSYAGISANGRGSVEGNKNTGGLIGYLKSGGVEDSYAAVPVSGGDATGGLVGLLEGVVQRTYATGLVQSTSTNRDTVGGLIGAGSGSVFNSFWNTETTGQSSSRGGNEARGLTTADMKSLATFRNKWGIDDEGGTDKIWRIYDGQTAPLLRSFLVTKDVDAKSVTYNAQTQTGCTGTPCGSAPGDLPFTAASGLNAGVYAPYSTQQGYDIRGGKLTITPFLLTPTAIAPEKTYDGTQDVLQNQLLSIKALGDDAVTVNYASAQYDNRNAGTDKTVTFSGIALGGASAGNYKIADTFQVGKAVITPLRLSLLDLAVADKMYDGGLTAFLSNNGRLANKVGNDDVTLDTTVSVSLFADKNVGQDKAVTISGLRLGGADALNYRIDSQTAKASITRRPLSLSGTKVADKVYDGGTAATLVSAGTLQNMVDNDKVTLSAAGAAFADRNAGDNKQVTVSGVALSGEDAGNYSIADTATTTASITKLALSLSGTQVDNKVYDGTTAATLRNAGTMVGKVATDKVAVNAAGASASFADKNAGDNKQVTVSGVALSGEDAGNYSIADTATTTASITKLALSLSGTQVDNKVYDGTTAATLRNAGTLSGKIGNDDVTVNPAAASASFADKNVGEGKAVTVSRLALTGADAANYVIGSSQTTTAAIQPRPLAVRAQGVDKIYDGNTNATVTLGDNRIEGDQLDLRYANASFADSNAGSSKTVTVAGIAASGADAGNYMPDSGTTTTANIAKAPLTITANPDSKTFDGKAYRGGNGVTYAGFVAGDNASALGGQPSYGGDSQGAVNPGSYRIAPAGYASQNYAIVYVDGELTIQPARTEPVYQTAGAAVAATAAAMNDLSVKPDHMRLLQQATLRVADCGARPPERIVAMPDCD